MRKRKTVLIVDDHPLFREGLKSLLARHSSFEVIGEAGNGNDGLKKAKKLMPDLVVMDISLPDQSGIEVTSKIRSLLPETRVIVLSMHTKIDYITEAFRQGATGYVVKESATEKLMECLEIVSKGEYFVDSSLSHRVVKSLLESDEKERKITDDGYNTLTPREQQVMRLLAEGHSTKQIAEKLFISAKTVENHRSNIMSKLEVHTIMELVRYAARLGLIDVDLWKG
ncbi:MAG: response regulator transcription factor [Desulfobacteraceae bacterium]|nr:MAG: response regulator transcription factor [Desulfobacteraceae bacterium]